MIRLVKVEHKVPLGANRHCFGEIYGDKEEILNGTLALTIYKGKGVEINLAKLFRMLRERFQRRQ